VRLPLILALYPVGRSTWWAGVKAGRFPAPVKLGPRVTAWPVDAIRDLSREAEAATTRVLSLFLRLVLVAKTGGWCDDRHEETTISGSKGQPPAGAQGFRPRVGTSVADSRRFCSDEPNGGGA
jgi:predicted DNA-binding transcriptional regulator AlpA